MYYFCTYFDQHYLPRGLVLYQSLRRHCSSFQLWVLCMDRACYSILSKLALPSVRLIALEDFEKNDEALRKAKQNRTRIEYYFTCTPFLSLFILNQYPEIQHITYLDADLFFFSDPSTIYDEMAQYSIAMIGHRFHPDIKDLERYGIYNVGWLSFRRDEPALTCLQWWRERCLEWCYDRVEDDRFADQKYLDHWPSRFPGVVVLQHKGANLAPWNLANYKIRGDGPHVWVDEQPLIFFHFQGLKQIVGWLYDPNLAGYKVKPFKEVLQSIYAPYFRALFEATRQISSVRQQPSLLDGIRDQTARPQMPKDISMARQMVREARRLLHIGKGIFTKKYIFVIHGRII